jgi:GNAT superfamily N-acetyltransferase
VIILEGTREEIKDFRDAEWVVVDRENLDLQIDGSWQPEQHVLKAVVDGEIVGVAEMRFLGGVATLSDIIVGRDWRNRGIGRQLVARFEAMAHDAGCHKLTLKTPADSPAVDFYTRLGYRVEARLHDHYFHRDFLQLSKSMPNQGRKGRQ